jgi:tetratricopeptide (TPR) repeat protein
VLELDDEQLDACRFERAARRGRAALEAGDVAQARAELELALALWRGSALAHLPDVPCVRSEAARLEDERLAAIEDRIEADLAIGRHGELAGELAQLASEHPYRERLHAQRMLALYRAGRQADALAAYRQARRVLVDELGIEPSTRLRELENAILAQDPGLLGGAGQPTSRVLAPAAAPPVHVPLPATTTVGRASELERLATAIDDVVTRADARTGQRHEVRTGVNAFAGALATVPTGCRMTMDRRSRESMREQGSSIRGPCASSAGPLRSARGRAGRRPARG